MPKAKEEHGWFKRDRLARLHFKSPHTGPLYVVNRASKLHEETVQTHTQDLKRIVAKHRKPIVALLVDGGPDYCPRSIHNLLEFGYFRKEQDLDALIISTHAPGQSARIPIERAWSVMSRLLAGMTLPISLAGELPPCEQPGLSDEERVPERAGCVGYSL